MMNPVPWLQMTNMISYQELVRTFPNAWICASIQSDIVMWGRLLDKQTSLQPKELKLLAELKKKIGL